MPCFERCNKLLLPELYSNAVNPLANNVFPIPDKSILLCVC